MCKLIHWSCFFSRNTMYRHFFWCASGKISIAAVALLAQCTKCSVTCRNSRKCASWHHIRFYSAQWCYRMKRVLSVLCGWELHMLEFLWVLMADTPLKKRSRIATLTQHEGYIQTAIENSIKCARKRRLDLQKDLMHAGVRICSSTMRRPPLEAGRIAKKTLKSSF